MLQPFAGFNEFDSQYSTQLCFKQCTFIIPIMHADHNYNVKQHVWCIFVKYRKLYIW